MFTSLRRMTRYAPMRAVTTMTQTPLRTFAAGNLDENGEPRFLENV